MLANDIFLLKNVRLSVQLLVFFLTLGEFPQDQEPISQYVSTTFSTRGEYLSNDKS